jgi:alanine racemase
MSLMKSPFFKGRHVVGIFSHFARADEPEEQQNVDQLKSSLSMRCSQRFSRSFGINPEI